MGKRDGVLHVKDISRIREISEMAQTTWETTTAILEDQSVLDGLYGDAFWDKYDYHQWWINEYSIKDVARYVFAVAYPDLHPFVINYKNGEIDA